jgi:hypothetical protein
METENFNSRTQGQRNARKSEDVSELRNGPTTTRPDQKKRIAPSWDIRFSSFLGLVVADVRHSLRRDEEEREREREREGERERGRRKW